MTETPQQQFHRVRYHVLREAMKRSIRGFVLVRVLVNLWLMLRTRSIIHPLARIDWNVTIGRRCFIGKATIDTLGGNGRIEIGDGSAIDTRATADDVTHTYVDPGEYTASLRVKDDKGGTPLHWAMAREQAETVQFLTGLGAKSDARDDSGCRPGDEEYVCVGADLAEGAEAGVDETVEKAEETDKKSRKSRKSKDKDEHETGSDGQSSTSHEKGSSD
mgnify:CR=1 FL=1